MSLITEYPAWFILFCIAAAVLYAGILYFKNRREEFCRATSRWLAALRFTAILVLSFLLLSPLVKHTFTKTEKPLIILAADNSASIQAGNDSAYYKNEFPEAMQQLADDLQKDYAVETFTFGDQVSENLNLNFKEKQTDMSSLFEELETRYANRNVGALVLASDGLYNRGLNPLYASAQFRFPVYPIALGDTTPQQDVFVSKVSFNRIAFLGNEFPVEVIVGANKCAGKQSTLTVSNGGKIIHSQNVRIQSDQYFETINLQFEAEKTGMQRYTIRLSEIDGEISIVNNKQDIFVDILDSKQKILLLSAAPHPDVSALKTAIESNNNYALTESTLDEYPGQIESYNLLILHQLPAAESMSEGIIAKARENKIPILYVVGSETQLSRFNNLNTGLQILSEQKSFNEALPVFNSDFTLFKLSENAVEAFRSFPPLLSFFGDYKSMTSATSLFYQQIGSVETGYPLILFNQTLDSKAGIIAGEGLWKWRLQDFQKNGSHQVFNELVSKIVQFMSVKMDKRFFRIEGKKNFFENEAVIFDAEVYNQSYELINTNDIEIKITNSSGDIYPYVFGKTADACQLNAGILPVDNYTWEATVNEGGKVYTDKGAFAVSPLNIEAINTIANHRLLFQLAEKTGGQLIYPDGMAQLADVLRQRNDITTVTYTERSYSEWINLPWVFALILALISLEWFIRKRAGSY